MFSRIGLCRRLASSLVVLLSTGAVVRADVQCPSLWYPTDGVGGADPAIYAMTMWDADGPGPIAPVLVVGGTFTTAGPIPANFIASWDGTNWSTLGTGMNGDVDSLTVMQNGLLVAGGAFTTAGGVTVNRIAAWDGASWSPIGAGPIFGMDNEVLALTVRLNGDLIAAGMFSSAGGTPVNRIARWDGANWLAMGNMNNIVWALTTMPNGDVIAGGQFTATSSVPANRLARWNGSTWANMTTVNSLVLSVNVDADGNLIVGGQFTFCGVAANHIAKLSGTTWSAFGSGILGPVWSARSLPDGSLVASGTFLTAGGHDIQSIARWDGADWSSLGIGIGNLPNMNAGNVLALVMRDDGSLLAGGVFTTADDQPSPNLARWAPQPPPLITQQPQSIVVTEGGLASFSIAAAGIDPLSYQWHKDGSPLSDGPTGSGSIVSGAATAALSISSVTPADAAAYQCVVSDTCGDTPSDPATLSVTPACDPCDANCDGSVNGFDVDDFVAALTGSGSGCSPCQGDVNGDGSVNGFDIDGFVNCLTGP